ncbi:MAG: hypothetical protein CMP06_14120 [Xanthomonadales bacterium]|nr:hypothetical protein [Xanthomonadales bacterium]
MAWWNAIGDVLRGGKDVAEVFVENKEHRGERRHEQVLADIDRDKASLRQFAAEFHARQNRTRWDSFVDGLNRLPRPLLTIVIISFFVLAPLDPERFLLIAQAYELMPPGYWALLSVIIGFYFGGRMQLKAQDMAVRKDAVQAAKDLVVMRKAFREIDFAEEPVESRIYDAAVAEGARKPTNSVIQRWLESRPGD